MAASEQKHMIQLDGLRAIAVLFVLIGHFHPRDHPVYTTFPWGEMGVHLFFVLSGFLITSILLRCRKLVADEKQSTAGAIRQFYIRRFLRIFPLYYLTLFILVQCNYPHVRESIGWHLSYLSNFYFILENSGFGRIAHFWTLAVEEQFYLTWPFLILLLPRRALLPLVIAVIASAPLFRLGVSLALPSQYYLARWWALFANVDTLGMGALLALLFESHSALVRYRETLLRIGTRAGGLLLSIYLVLYAIHRLPPGVEIVFFRSIMGLFFLGLIGRAATGFSGGLGRTLSFAPMVYIGKISYGIYVVHFFMPEFLGWLIIRAGGNPALPLPAYVILNSMATVLVATVSWYVVENPINGLKKYFTYEGHGPRRSVASVEPRAVDIATR